MQDNKRSMLIITIIFLWIAITYASTSQTLSFFGSIGDGTVKNANWLLGLVNDISKSIFPIIIGIAFQQRKYFLTVFLTVITVITMIISYMASQGLDLNIALTNEQETLINSDIYKMNNESYRSSNDTIASLQAKKNTLENTNIEELYKSDTKIASLKREYASAKAKSWITTPAGSPRRGMDVIEQDIENRKSQIASEVSRNIENISTEISTKENIKNNASNELNNITSDKLAVTKGYHALAKSMGTTVDEITKWKNIFTEILAITLSITLGFLLGGSSIITTINEMKIKKKEKKIEGFHNDNVVTATAQEIEKPEKNKSIGFSYENIEKELPKLQVIESKIYDNNMNGVDSEDVKKYIKVMYQTQKNGTPIGYQRICTIAEIESSKRRGVFEYIKLVGIIHTGEGATKILMTEKEAYKIINQK